MNLVWTTKLLRDALQVENDAKNVQDQIHLDGKGHAVKAVRHIERVKPSVIEVLVGHEVDRLGILTYSPALMRESVEWEDYWIALTHWKAPHFGCVFLSFFIDQRVRNDATTYSSAANTGVRLEEGVRAR